MSGGNWFDELDAEAARREASLGMSRREMREAAATESTSLPAVQQPAAWVTEAGARIEVSSPVQPSAAPTPVPHQQEATTGRNSGGTIVVPDLEPDPHLEASDRAR